MKIFAQNSIYIVVCNAALTGGMGVGGGQGVSQLTNARRVKHGKTW